MGGSHGGVTWGRTHGGSHGGGHMGGHMGEDTWGRNMGGTWGGKSSRICYHVVAQRKNTDKISQREKAKYSPQIRLWCKH